MRVWTIAAIAGLSLAAAGAVEARTWTDPAGRLVVDAPSGWSVIDQHNPNMTYIIVGTANDECHVAAIPREETASISARAIRGATLNPVSYTDEAWARVAGGFSAVFSAPPQVLSRSTESDTFWPIQRAELQGERLVHGAIKLRPGLEMQIYCQTFEGADATAAYDAVIRSVGTPNDATLQAQAEAEAEAAAAAAAAAAAPAAPAAPPAH